MPINNRHIAIDNLDVPNQPYPPMRPDYRRTEFEPPKAKPINARVYAVLVGFGVAVAALLAYLIIRLANYVAYVNNDYSAPALDRNLLTALKLAVVAGCVLLVFVGVSGAIVFVLQRMLVRMQNNQPVSIFDVINGWRNPRAYNFGREAIQWYYAERRHWAQASLYWSLNTLDLSRSDSVTMPPLDHDIIDSEVINGTAMLPALTGTQTMIERLLKSGLINRSGNSLCIGFSKPDQPAYAELDDTGFIALAGQPRTGKSATASFLIAQVALIPDSIIIICDKHGRKDDSLLTRLAPIAHRFARTAIDTHAIIEAIDYWHEIGANRLLDDQDRSKYAPCFLVIDEFTAMILLSLLPASTIHKLVAAAIEYPKVQTHGLIIGHQWTGKLLGSALGTPLRRVTTQRIIHRIDPQDAAFLMPPAYAKQCQTLPEGRVIFMGANQPTPIELTIPYMSADDITYVAGLLPQPPAQIRHNAADVAAVAAVAAASERVTAGNHTVMHNTITVPTNIATLAASTPDGIDLDPNDDPITAVDVDPDLYDTDRRTRLAKLLLAKQTNGKYQYSYREVQAMSQLRTATICALAHQIGRIYR